MHQVAVESAGLLLDPWAETVSLLSLHYDVKSLELWRLRASSDMAGFPLGLVAHQFLGQTSPFQPLHPGVVKGAVNSKSLFLLVCTVSMPPCLCRNSQAYNCIGISADE
jgi:hypothetical protein